MATLQAQVLAARQEREAQSLKRWEEDMSVIETFEDFSEWLHLTHLCYAVPRQSEFGVPTALDDVALQSY